MSILLFEALKQYVGLGADDRTLLKSLHPRLRAAFPTIVGDFFQRVCRSQETRKLLKSDEQGRRLQAAIGEWLEEIFLGPQDGAYFEKRERIGRTQFRIGLLPCYTSAAMSQVRSALEAAIVTATAGEPQLLCPALSALGKVLGLDHALMTHFYYEERAVEWQNTVLGDNKGRITGTLSSEVDLTDRLRMEKILVEQKSLARLGEMASVVAHEVKNSLAGIGGAMQVLASSLPKENSYSSVIHEILERIDFLNETINDLLLFARPRKVQLETVSLRALIQSLLLLLENDSLFDKIGFDIFADDLSIPADGELLKMAFQNLVLNAAQAMNGEGRIAITMHANEEHCRIAVRDTGPGIPGPIREKVFEPFFSTKHRATGLGLPIAKRIVEAHGGQIALHCPPEGGTEVLIQLPRQAVKPQNSGNPPL
ncbi:MAG: hypothetical protein HY717_19845 [Planctomycetes bacterium]|nr:hypothetical protein [Planctomycetota bacterium]